jgi:hypothetical protein
VAKKIQAKTIQHLGNQIFSSAPAPAISQTMNRLTRSFSDRVVIGLLGLLFAPIAGLMIHVRLATGAVPDAHGEWVLSLWFILLGEAVCSVFAISVMGVIWAVCTPRWIERLARISVHHFLWILLAMAVIIAGIFGFLIFFQR